MEKERGRACTSTTVSPTGYMPYSGADDDSEWSSFGTIGRSKMVSSNDHSTSPTRVSVNCA